MPRMPRLLWTGTPSVYHVVSRTALPGFRLGDVERERLLEILRDMSGVYFAEVLGFCLMGNHFHLLVRMHPGEEVADDEIRRRFRLYSGTGSKRALLEGQVPSYRGKWESLSESVREIKQRFSRWYNKRPGRRGFFWGERFQSVLVEDGDTLGNCLAYIDSNPVRAGLAERPEDYRWCSLGHHVQAGNRDGLLPLGFGLRPFAGVGDAERLRLYRTFPYETGSLPGRSGGAAIAEEVYETEARRGFEIPPSERLRYRTRYFTASGVIGTRRFVAAGSQRFQSGSSGKRPEDIRRLWGEVGAVSAAADPGFPEPIVPGGSRRGRAAGALLRERSSCRAGGSLRNRTHPAISWMNLQAAFGSRREKKPRPVEGIAGLYALERLRAH